MLSLLPPPVTRGELGWRSLKTSDEASFEILGNEKNKFK